MKDDTLPYKPFTKFVMRTPLFPLELIKELYGNNETSIEKIKEICNNKVVQEATFLASPDLYEELKKWLNGELTNSKEVDKIQISMTKYLLRMASRCTPFGLFAGCTLGEIDERTDIRLHSQDKFLSHTRLDMNYLCGLSQELSRHLEIKSNIRFYPNSSLYKVGDQIRYVEYSYNNSRRVHHIIAVYQTEYLNKVIDKSTNGLYIKELANLLVNNEINYNEAESFINELIRNQLLVSELEPAITGPEFLDQILEVLKSIENIEEIKNNLISIRKKLKEIDNSSIGISVSKYYEIIDIVKVLGTGYESKYLFQSDMKISCNSFKINSQIVSDVWRAIEVMNYFSAPIRETNMSKFRDAFYERYEEAEVPLLKALDVESGIGYLQNNSAINGDVTPLVDDIILPQNQNLHHLSWDKTQSFLLKKYHQALQNNSYEIEITEKDLDLLSKNTINWNEMPLTISAMAQLLANSDGSDHPVQLFINSAGGSSSANLLGRFGHLDHKIYKYVKEITAKEQELINNDAILAEIVHLPESRIGNILLRPVYRDYEISYLAKSAVASDMQIKLDDIMISVRRNRIVLRSKRLDKEIIPRLSTAHNYSSNALPIYQFLCDLQTQGLRGGVGFNWGALENEYGFLPRVNFKNIIFYRATWNISKEEIKTIYKINNDLEVAKAIKFWREERKIPKYIALVEGDNELVLNLENTTCIKTFLSSVKRKSLFKIKEFLYDSEYSFIKSGDKSYTNQVVFSFYKTGDILKV